MRRKLTIAVTVATLLAAAPLLSACYTTQGAGQDLKAAGQGISNSAAEHTHYNP
jgi:predicted small secreted protein